MDQEVAYIRMYENASQVAGSFSSEIGQITRPYDAADGQKEGMATARRCGSFQLITPHASSMGGELTICMYLPQDHWT